MWLDGELQENGADFGYYMLSNHMTRILCGAHLTNPNELNPRRSQWPLETEGSRRKKLEPIDHRHLECAKQK